MLSDIHMILGIIIKCKNCWYSDQKDMHFERITHIFCMGLMINLTPVVRRVGGRGSDTPDTPLLDHSNGYLIIGMTKGVVARPI